MRQPAPPLQTVTRTPSSASTSSTISTSSSEEEWSTSHQSTEPRSESGYSSLDLEEPYNTTTKDKSSLQGQSHSVVVSKGHTGLDRKWTENAESKSKTDDEEERLRQENLRLKDERLCKICADKELGVVFIPCGHFVTCTNCASLLTNCPVCRSRITSLVKTYLS